LAPFALSLVGAVKTRPCLVGEEDHRTPPSEAEQFYQALQLRGVPTTLIRVPGASHEAFAERPSQLTAEVAAILAWFEPATRRPRRLKGLIQLHLGLERANKVGQSQAAHDRTGQAPSSLT